MTTLLTSRRKEHEGLDEREGGQRVEHVRQLRPCQDLSDLECRSVLRLPSLSTLPRFGGCPVQPDRRRMLPVSYGGKCSCAQSVAVTVRDARVSQVAS